MLTFDKPWGEEISEVTNTPEYQSCTIQLWKPGVLDTSAYDPSTNLPPTSQATKVYDGPARIKPIRLGLNMANNDGLNPSTLRKVHIQFPHDAVFSVSPRSGFTAKVTASAEVPDLLTKIFTLKDTLFGSTKASNTFEFSYDGDAVIRG